MTNRPYLKLIHNSVKNDGVTFEEITPNYVYRAQRGDKSFVMIDTEIGLNSSSSAKIALHKSVTSDVLRHAGIPAVEHVFLPNPNSKFDESDSYALALQCFHRFNGHVVVKQDDGSQGNHVYKIDQAADLPGVLDVLFSLELNAAISPFYDAELEYRVVTLNHEPSIFLAKKRTTSWKHNLISGAVSLQVEEKQKLEVLSTYASRTTRAIGIDFCSVDVLETNQGLFVLEVNNKVMLDEYRKHDPSRASHISDLYRAALLNRFDRLH